MSNEKQQIEEMAKVIKSSLDGLGSGNFNFTGDEISTMFAKALYNADYRKQSEGKWIFEHEFYGKMLCTNCKEEALINEWDEYVDSDFCPNCGAKMKGGE